MCEKVLLAITKMQKKRGQMEKDGEEEDEDDDDEM